MSITSRDDTSIETDRTREQIPADSKAPSPARRRFDRREILRSTGDVIGPARGLRVGGKRRRSCEQQRDRKGERDFAHQFFSLGLRDVPHLAVPRPPILPSSVFWSTRISRIVRLA